MCSIKRYSMRKILLILIPCLTLYACGSGSPVYTVMEGSEAIITQKGEIVRGPVKPGLHFKLPFAENVHEFKVCRIEQIPIKLNSFPEYTASILWKIQEPKAFYYATRDKDIKIVLDSLSDKFQKALKNIETDKIAQIAEGQESDCNYSNHMYENIKESIQSQAKSIGIEIYSIIFKKVNAAAQQRHSHGLAGAACLSFSIVWC